MDSILGILFNLFEGLDLEKVLSSVEGSMIEYNVSVALDTFSSFFGGLLSKEKTKNPSSNEEGFFN